MTELAGVRAKLKAHKDANTGTRTVTLDESGVTLCRAQLDQSWPLDACPAHCQG